MIPMDPDRTETKDASRRSPDPASLAKSLVGVIRDLAGLYGRLLRIMVREKDAVVRADHQALTALLAEKEREVERIREAESRRTAVIADLGEALGLPTDQLTLGQIAPLLPDPYPVRLLAEGEQLAGRLSDVKAANQLNKSLIGHSLDVVRQSMDMLKKIDERLKASHQVYSRNGEVRDIKKGDKVLSSKA